MTTSELIKQLHNLSEIDVQDIGEDVNGNPIFAIKINNSVGSFINDTISASVFAALISRNNNDIVGSDL